MVVKTKAKRPSMKSSIIYEATYQGRVIATAKSFNVLMKNKTVNNMLGKKGLVIKHSVPEGMFAI